MTDGTPATPWYLRPAVVLPVLAVLVVAAALSAPEVVNGRSGDSRLTTYSTEPQGAAMFFELARRLGWQVSRRTTPLPAQDPRDIQAVLAPPEALRALEVHALLEDARDGAALLLVLPGSGGPLNDSLHAILGNGGTYLPADSTGAAGCRESSGVIVPLWPGSHAALYSLRWTAPPPDTLVEFAQVDLAPSSSDSADYRPAVVGFRYGQGRIVIASDPDFLRNDALRECRYGLSVPAVWALEYLTGGGPAPRRRVVFDEYHQGFGPHPGTFTAIAGYLSAVPSGRMLLQLVAAGLVLLLAGAPRVMAPRDTSHVQRRSPLEHVDALARAYAQVGATRTATARAVDGVRRRLGLAAARATAGLDDDEFLAWAVRTAPSTAGDARRIRRALEASVSRQELAHVGAALARLEASLTVSSS